MASMKVLLLLVALMAPLALANDTPPGGCAACSGTTLAYAHIPTSATRPAGVLPYFRFGESIVSSSSGTVSGAFTGNRNYVYLYVSSSGPNGSGGAGKSLLDNLLPASAQPADIATVGGPNHCCFACAATPGCYYYAYYPNDAITFTGTYPTYGGKAVTAAGQPADSSLASFSFESDVVSTLPTGVHHKCNLLGAGHPPSDYSFQPTSKNSAAQAANPKVILGGKCNPTIADDPHLIGARGTKFDFNGGLGQTFCLVTDNNVHVNVLLDGYVAADKTDGKGLRTWIKEVGLIWRHEGVEHTAHMVARRGKQQERGNGFLTSLTVDGVSVPVPAAAGNSASAPGAFQITFVGTERKHVFEIDHFTVVAAGLLEMDVRMRVAHPNMQSADDAQAHFNLGFDKIENTPSIHGVLGQTYRTTDDQAQRAAKYQQLAKSLSGPLLADGANGKGFLDGEIVDYLAPSILSPICKFSPFAAAQDDNSAVAKITAQ